MNTSADFLFTLIGKLYAEIELLREEFVKKEREIETLRAVMNGGVEEKEEVKT